MKHLKSFFIPGIALGILMLVQACEHDESLQVEVARGKLLSFTLLQEYSIEEADSIIDAYDDFLAGYPVDYPINIYRITYTTINTFGQETMASGAVVVPMGSTTAFPLCSYQHGTITEKYEAPSYEGGELFLGVVFAPSGYVVCMPDYLGLGDGEGLHPYCHAKSEATAVVDMLRATKELCSSLAVALNDQLFLFGYSQGGHATMAAVREIETLHTDEFTITASAPMSGPYDISGVQTDVVVEEAPYAAPYYLPYLMFSYNEAYSMYDEYADFLKSPYDTLLPPLFDGMHSGGDIDAVMPEIPNDIIRDEVFEDFQNNPENPFRAALRNNDLIYDWIPRSPMILFYCTGDELVNYQNSIIAVETFSNNGSAAVSAFDSNPLLGHQDCAEPSFIYCRNWFDSLKE
jgi:hypothetical protein